jgi:hypothetical protein
MYSPRYWASYCVTQISKRISQSRWPCGLRCGSAAARFLGLPVRIPSEAWMSVSCECCAFGGRGLGDRSIPRPRESYRLCVIRWNNKSLHLQWVDRNGSDYEKDKLFCLTTSFQLFLLYSDFKMERTGRKLSWPVWRLHTRIQCKRWKNNKKSLWVMQLFDVFLSPCVGSNNK